MLIYYVATVVDNTYKPASGRSITVKYKDSGDTATIFSSKAGAASGNPLVTDSNGQIKFWATYAEYTLATGTEELDITIEEALGQTEIVTIAIAASTITVDGYAGNAFKTILTEDVTLVFDNIIDSDNDKNELTRYELFVAQDATGSWEITFPGSVVFLEGTAQQPRPGVNVVTKYTLDTYDNGATWYASIGGGSTSYGDVFGSASSTDHGIVRANGTDGKNIQSSGWTIDDADKMSAGGTLDMGAQGFDDNYLSAPIPLSEVGTTNLGATFTAVSIIAALNENKTSINSISSVTFNTYTTVAAAELATGSDNARCYVVETESYYRYEADGSAYTDDNTFVLSTGDAGNTRWLAVSGQYVYQGLNMLGQGNVVRRDEWLQNGFVGQSDNSTMTFSDATPDRTLSIQPTATSFDFYEEGVKYTSTGDTVAITDVEGEHVVYYDGGVLTALANPTDDQISTVIRTKCIVSYLYWNATANEHIYFGEERHGFNMNPITHTLLHFRDGLIYMLGLGLSGFSIDGDGSSDTHSQFGIDLGAVADEDIFKFTGAVASTVGFPVLYFDGANRDLRRGINAGYSVLVTTTKPDWNEWTGAVWQRTEMTDDYYAWCHTLATTDIDKEIFVHMGLAEYVTEVSAKRGLTGELEQFINGGAQIAEYRYVGSSLIKANSAFANTNKFICASTSDGDEYYDLRTANMSRQIVDLGIQELDYTGVAAYVSATAPTTCTTLNQWYPLAGTFSNSPVENFTLQAGPPPSIRYDGKATTQFIITYDGSTSGNSNGIQYELGVAKNASTPAVIAGEVISNSINRDRLITSGIEQPISGTGVISLETNDDVTIVIRSTNGSGDILTAEKLTTTIKPFFG